MKRVLITGASSGIGQELATRYLQSGNQVIVCGRDEDRLRAAFDAADNARLAFCCCDIDQLADTLQAMGQHKDLDLVILNAGTCEYVDHLPEFDSELFERVIRTNVVGTGYCLQATLPNIRRGGQLAIVSSTVTLLPLTRSEAYGASKAALDYLARTLAVDLACHKIDVSLVRPGFVDTPLTRKNDFPMPGMVSVEQASEYIIAGLQKRRRNIGFPRGFYWAMKCLAMLPDALWHRISVKMARNNDVH